jgi:flavodoxin
MMNILVTYFSLSGNTKKIADAFVEELTSQAQQVTIKDLVEISPATLQEFDLVFLGAACHDSDLAESAIGLLEKIDYTPKYKLAGFVTHATTMPDHTERNQQLYTQWAGKCIQSFHRLSADKGFDFLGFFHCQGAPVPPIAEFIHQEIIPDEQEWEEYLNEVRDHPNQKDIDDAKTFAREVIQKYERI